MASAARTSRVLLVAGQALARAAYGRLIASFPGVELVGEAAAPEEAFPLHHRHHAEVVVVEARLEAAPTAHTTARLHADAVRSLVAAVGGARIVLITEGLGAQRRREALALGVAAVVFLYEPEAALRDAVCRVAAASPAEVSVPAGQGPRLSARELEVVSLVGAGMRNKAIALRLGLSDVTVRHHLTSIFRKVGVEDRLELALYARRQGIVSDRHN